ncbi:hypothetical protein Csa_007749, partial [Cucumis sativus]
MGVNWTGKRRRERKTRCYVEVKVAERTAEPRATAIGWRIGLGIWGKWRDLPFL